MASDSTNYSCYRKWGILNLTKKMLMEPTERTLHSMLSSRVLLNIRAVAGDNGVRSEGLAELSTLTFRDVERPPTLQ